MAMTLLTPQKCKTLRASRSLSRCSEGTTVIEFAILAPVLFLLLAGIIELGCIFFTYTVIEGATNIGSRTGKTGYAEGVSKDYTREAYIRDQIKKRAGGFINTSLIDIKFTTYKTFDEIGNEDKGTADSAGNSGDVVLYTVSYPWNVVTPMLGSLIGKDGKVTISAIATVRNE